MIVRLPPHRRAARIGLLGGSFDPAHDGHRHLSLKALRRLRLDAVWWLVSPGNPLKPSPAATLAIRLAVAARAARHPRIKVTALEAEAGTRFTADTLAWLRRRAPRVRFVWLMGADNLAGFAAWRRWRRIAALAPIAVGDRPNRRPSDLARPPFGPFRRRVLPERLAARLSQRRPPALMFLRGPVVALSSTGLRARARRRGSS